MHPTATTAASLCLLLAACGHDAAPALLQSADGRYRVMFVGDGQGQEAAARQQMEAAMAQLPAIDLVFAHNDTMAHAAALAARARQRTGIRFLGVDARVDEGRRLVQEGLLTATFEDPPGAAAALDLAVLACRGIEVRRAVHLPTRVFTADEPAGRIVVDQATLAAGEVPALVEAIYLEDLRRRYATLLKAASPVLDIALVVGAERGPWSAAVLAEAQAWADEHPNVRLTPGDAGGDRARERELVDQFSAQRVDAIVVAAADPQQLSAACKAALAQGIAVVALDRDLGNDACTCFVGADDVAIGRAVGQEIGRLLPAGGTIVEIQGPAGTATTTARQRGFAEVLGLAPPAAR